MTTQHDTVLPQRPTLKRTFRELFEEGENDDNQIASVFVLSSDEKILAGLFVLMFLYVIWCAISGIIESMA